ncbi:MAG: tRNA (guanosine(37)-N1)-methyltransferase TrmD [Candidatus Liptonbacteria bacterium]|nr:tRNA (guanosine(37)-N1)-methyltransferase TrmD [Candidatus Liptonbacteria bacterium]
MIFSILSIFPEAVSSYLQESLLKRAQDRKLVRINRYDLRDFAHDPHRKVDDRPFGGGPGMVLQVGPIHRAVREAKSDERRAPSEGGSASGGKSKEKKTRVILFSTRGKVFDARAARRLSKYDHLIFICGRYEGVDERVAKYVADEELSIGDYVLSGGELPALVVIEAISRFLPGFLGKGESLEEVKGSYPVYTRPEVYRVSEERPALRRRLRRGERARSALRRRVRLRRKEREKTKSWKVPKVLLSGDHAKIAEWRRKH